MKTRKWTYLTISTLLLVVVAVGLSAGAAAAPAAAPRAQISGAPMDPLPEVACTVVDTTRTCELWALAGTLTVPGGSLPVWGFSDNAAGPALVPGPVIRALVGETLEVVLHNEIAGQSVSLAFPSQVGVVPDLVGVPVGETATTTLNALTAGTFLYEAGLTEGGARQVAMGLFGALIVEDPAVTPTWNQEVVLVLSEIDPAFNINPAGYSMNRFRPKYWLINGQAYPDTGWIETVAGNTVLMRYLNAGVEHHTIGTLGLDQLLVASNGVPLPFPRGAIAPAMAPGQTLEAVLQVPAAATPDTLYPLYNASLHQHNNNQRLADTRAAFGGMLTYLRVMGEPAPVPVGPVASSVTVTPQKTNGTADVILSATLTDPDLVAAYEYFVDTVGPAGTGTAVVVAPASPVAASVTFPAAEVASWTSGEHILYIRGQDVPGTWGALGSAVLNLDMAGPDIVGLTLAPNPTNGSVDVTLSGTADDHSNGNSSVVAAEYRIDGGAWQPVTLANPGAPLSGLSAVIPAATVNALPEGERLVEVRAQDEWLNWSVVNGSIGLRLDKTGPDVPTVTLNPNTLDFNQQVPVASVRLTATIADPLASGIQSIVVKGEGFLYTQTAPGTGFALYPSDGLFDEVSETAHYDIPVSTFATLPDGVYDILVVGKDKAGNWGPAGTASITVVAKVVDVTGPEITNLVATVARNGNRFDLTATATDTLSNVYRAVWWVGQGPDNPMSAVDGAFDSLSEDIEALRVDSRNWAAGNYTISVAAMDALGNWGPTATTQITIP